MSELARQRDARDLWISRGHLFAMAAGTFVLAATTFALGFTIGREKAPPQAPMGGGMADDRPLVELLARVEASSHVYGGVERLTFPDILEGNAQVPELPPLEVLPTPAPTDAALATPMPVGKPVLVEPALAHNPVGDAPRDGAFTIEVSRTDDEAQAITAKERLRATGLDAWLLLEDRDGKPAWRVEVGGYVDSPAADLALTEVVTQIKAAGVIAAPTIVPRGH